MIIHHSLKKKGRLHIMEMSNCIHGDTLVVLSSYERVKISELLYGVYEVFSYNEESEMIEKDNISNVHISKYVSSLFEIKFENEEVLRCTEDHQVLVSEETCNVYKEIRDLRIGDKLWGGIHNQLGILGEEQEIVEIKKIKSGDKIPVYDFETSNNNVLIAIKDKMINVHNSAKESN